MFAEWDGASSATGKYGAMTHRAVTTNDGRWDGMTRIRRGDIFYIEKSGYETGCEQRSGRPGVIVSNDMNNTHSQVVEVVYCTAKHKPELPTHVMVTSTPKESTALCEQVTSVAVERLGNYVGRCSDQEMEGIARGVLVSLGFGDVAPEMPSSQAEEVPADEIGREKEILKLRAELSAYKKMFDVVVGKLADAAAGAPMH